MLIWTDRGYKTVGGEVVWPKAPAAVIKTTMAWVNARNESVANFNKALEQAQAVKRMLGVAKLEPIPVPDYCLKS